MRTVCEPALVRPCSALHVLMSWFVVLCRYVSRDRNIVQFYGACVQTNSLLLVIATPCWQRSSCRTLLQAEFMLLLRQLALCCSAVPSTSSPWHC